MEFTTRFLTDNTTGFVKESTFSVFVSVEGVSGVVGKGISGVLASSDGLPRICVAIPIFSKPDFKRDC